LFGNTSKTLVAITDAFHEQTHIIRWESFHQGQVSLKWGKAFQSFGTYNDDNIIQWLSGLIRVVLDYTKNLWDYHNGMVHGHTKEEEKNSDGLPALVSTSTI
jgi:hypothetical protein